MTDLNLLDNLFFIQNNLDKDDVEKITAAALEQADDGELFLEHCQSEAFTFDDGVLKGANYNVGGGFGLRSVVGETVGYAHSSEISKAALKRAHDSVKATTNGYEGTLNLDHDITRTNKHLYGDFNPLEGHNFSDKTELLAKVDSYIRAKHKDVSQVSVSLAGEWQAVEIIKRDNISVGDIRPLVRMNISVVVDRNGRMERGSYGFGGRQNYDNFFLDNSWQHAADKAIDQALINLESIDAPAGEMQVVLGSGWPGILLHEAVGHGLEGDFNRKKTSAFSSLIGKQVASKGVTVIDDGTINKRRGSLTIDDEGTPTQKTTLIEDGILVGYMQDRMNARLMNTAPTGNGRRESYAHQPLPRMTNTYMLGGEHQPEEILSSVKNGLYAVNFGGGQVDITSGKFVFSASEAYLIENGKVTKPVKGATLIGNGPDCLTKVSMIGNDMQLDDGIGTCGKAGQGVPVGVGQPTLLIDELTVGGTAG